MGKIDLILRHLRLNGTYYLIAVICVTAFFAHENFVSELNDIDKVKVTWESQKAKRTSALGLLKDEMKGTPEYEGYWIEKVKTDVKYKEYLDALEEQKYFGFNNFQQFMGEFGPWLGLFIYSLFNLVLVFIKKPKSFNGEVILHTTLITISIFYLRWCFNKIDFFGSKYVFFNLLTVAMIIMSTYFFVKHKEWAYDKLQKALESVSRFAFIGVRKHIKEESVEEYEKDSINALNDGRL